MMPYEQRQAPAPGLSRVRGLALYGRDQCIFLRRNSAANPTLETTIRVHQRMGWLVSPVWGMAAVVTAAGAAEVAGAAEGTGVALGAGVAVGDGPDVVPAGVEGLE